MLKLLKVLVGVPLAAVGFCVFLSMTVLALSDAESRLFSISTAVIGLVVTWAGMRLVNGRPANDESWRNDPASAKQKSFATDLGIKFPKNITKGDLSDLISEETGR